uniref:Putative secreted protein n=1 Tax=Ixodes ricinus TaxID=34613 RepID=A0A6B0ULV8_IXORI
MPLKTLIMVWKRYWTAVTCWLSLLTNWLTIIGRPNSFSTSDAHSVLFLQSSAKILMQASENSGFLRLLMAARHLASPSDFTIASAPAFSRAITTRLFPAWTLSSRLNVGSLTTPNI